MSSQVFKACFKLVLSYAITTSDVYAITTSDLHFCKVKREEKKDKPRHYVYMVVSCGKRLALSGPSLIDVSGPAVWPAILSSWQ